MVATSPIILLIAIAIGSEVEGLNVFKNVSCYQCTENSQGQGCSPQDLKPCPLTYDRCLSHYTRDKVKGVEIRRECGLAPCRFPESALSNSLASQFESCDFSKKEYFCVFCCTGNGCNTATTSSKPLRPLYYIFTSLVLPLYLFILSYIR